MIDDKRGRMQAILVYLAMKYKGDFISIFNALNDFEKVPDEDVIEINNKIKNNEIKVITIIDEDYPDELKEINRPPFVLWYEGNKQLLKNKKISLVGDELKEITKKYISGTIKRFMDNYVLVSNSFKGTEQYITDEYIKHNKEVIIVSANGIKNPWISNNLQNIYDEDNYLIISSYPESTSISKKRLKERNALVSALANNLFIYSSKVNSGINDLVNKFLTLGKEIFCFPGDESDQDDGNVSLISEGATMVSESNFHEFC